MQAVLPLLLFPFPQTMMSPEGMFGVAVPVPLEYPEPVTVASNTVVERPAESTVTD